MSGVHTVTVKSTDALGGCASPGVGILKHWQGVLEMILRVVVMVRSME